MDRLFKLLGEAIDDVCQESFLLFSQTIPSTSLGFVDNNARELSLDVAGKDFTVLQSPSLLRSDRKRGTTGAVLWQVTPRVANWIVSPDNFLFSNGIISSESIVLELGCGISGILAMTLSPRIGTYIATDQDYVLKHVKNNIALNCSHVSKQSTARAHKGYASTISSKNFDNIHVLPLDWETDLAHGLVSQLNLESGVRDLSLVIACDCIYNEALVDPLVDMCIDICRMSARNKPSLCLVAQQLRSPDIFEAWLTSFHDKFQVWRLPDHLLNIDLGQNSGFSVHVGMLRTED